MKQLWKEQWRQVALISSEHVSSARTSCMAPCTPFTHTQTTCWRLRYQCCCSIDYLLQTGVVPVEEGESRNSERRGTVRRGFQHQRILLRSASILLRRTMLGLRLRSCRVPQHVARCGPNFMNFCCDRACNEKTCSNARQLLELRRGLYALSASLSSDNRQRHMSSTGLRGSVDETCIGFMQFIYVLCVCLCVCLLFIALGLNFLTILCCIAVLSK
jgi:hypothetical protein